MNSHQENELPCRLPSPNKSEDAPMEAVHRTRMPPVMRAYVEILNRFYINPGS